MTRKVGGRIKTSRTTSRRRQQRKSSVLRPVLFGMMMDRLTDDVRQEAPRTLTSLVGRVGRNEGQQEQIQKTYM